MDNMKRDSHKVGLAGLSYSFSFFAKLVSVLMFAVTLGLKNTSAEEALPSDLANVGIDEKLGSQVPLDATFKDENGNDVILGQYFKPGKPVLVNFAYYRCPMLCNLVLNGMLNAIKPLAWLPGNEYEVITIGIDAREKPDVANAKKTNHMEELGRPGAEKGWHFLTGSEDQIKKVADAFGFRFAYNASQDDYAHQAAIFTVSPKGIISRYLYGIDFPPKDLRLALLDASSGRALSLGEKLVMFCYRYDPESKSYVLFAHNFMRGGGYVVLVGLAALLGLLWRKEIKRKIASRVTNAEPGA